ncbi:MAG: [NiFe] hydrogenase nickel incorporation protein HypA [Myxococcales bacterium]|nr:[NiFe] hydrogenase nickel incorporation protein HypA [Myxococcales bacterium]
MDSVVETVVEELGSQRIAVVRLEIGELSGVAVDALRFCFEVCTRGTVLADTALDIVMIPARARCRSCGGEHATSSLMAACVCGSFDRELICGDELRLKEVEVV